uniref:Putative secreted protein n=1 Tax=Anopheles darlingi TaxID=43151 RepID=A0A2M4DG21_ANODA
MYGVDVQRCAMLLQRLLRLAEQLILVELGSARIVLLLRISSVAVMLPEELGRIRVTTDLHLANLYPGPVRVQIGGAHER